jgi:hypothetical protein
MSGDLQSLITKITGATDSSIPRMRAGSCSCVQPVNLHALGTTWRPRLTRRSELLSNSYTIVRDLYSLFDTGDSSSSQCIFWRGISFEEEKETKEPPKPVPLIPPTLNAKVPLSSDRALQVGRNCACQAFA